MKRSIVVTLVILALIILVSPGIVGRLAERNLEQGIDWARSDSPDVIVTTEKFDRGWFTSEGRHRVSLRHGALQAAAGDGMPSLVIDTRFDHGLIPLSSMSLESGSLKPGLVRMVSTLHLDDGHGNLTAIPGTVFSETDLGGETTGRYVLEAGSRDDANGTAIWGGADLRFVANNARRDLSVKGEAQPWSYDAGANSASFGLFTIDARQTDGGYGFPVGELDMTVESVAIYGADGLLGGFERLAMTGGSTVAGESLNARARMSLDRMAVPEVGEMSITVDAVMNGLDAASLGRISAAFNEARAAGDPEAALGELFPAIQDDLETLLAAGGEVRFNQLDIALPDGAIRSTLALTLAESSGAFSWPAAILASTASANISVSEALVEMGLQMNPEAGSLIDMGFLQLDGGVYRMKAEFAGGLLTVNGVPLPIPLPLE